MNPLPTDCSRGGGKCVFVKEKNKRANFLFMKMIRVSPFGACCNFRSQ